METVQPHDHAVDLDTALDFVNTLKFDDGQEVEVLGTTAEALDWLHHHGLVHYEVLARSDVASVLRRIHRTRAALRELADATYEHRAPAQAAVDEVNRALRAREVVQLVPGPGGLQLDHRHVGDPIDDALANLTEPIVREIAGGRPERPQGMRRRHLSVGLLRRLADGPSTLVRHVELRQQGEGRPAPRPGQGGRAGARLSVSRGRRCSRGARRR